MKRLVLMLVVMGAMRPVWAQESAATPSMLLQEAIYAERTEGDLDKAIEKYEKVIQASQESRRILALAVFRLASCYSQKGQADLAQMHFERVVEEFSEYTSLVNRARNELKMLQPKTPEPQIEKKVLLKDSLEKGTDVPNKWVKKGNVPGVQYVWDKQVASQGNASLCLDKTVDRYFPIAQWVREIKHTGEGTCLMISSQVKAEKVTKAVIDVLFLDKDGEWISHEWVSYIGPKDKGLPFTHNWKLYSGQVDIPDDTVTMMIGLQMYGPGKVWFDEIEVAYVPEEPVKSMTDIEVEKVMAEAWSIWQKQKFAEAETLFEQVVQNRPNMDTAYQGLGWAQLNSGKVLAAGKTFQQCIKLNPKNFAALNGLGWIAYRDKRFDAAITWWTNGVEVSQGGATACLAGLTRVYMEQKKYDDAIKYYELWLKVDPDSAQAKDGLSKAKQAQQG